jgi:hypothetical protein
MQPVLHWCRGPIQTAPRGPSRDVGVAVDREGELVFGSDIRTGLWVLKPPQ